MGIPPSFLPFQENYSTMERKSKNKQEKHHLPFAFFWKMSFLPHCFWKKSRDLLCSPHLTLGRLSAVHCFPPLGLRALRVEVAEGR
jgi:hypothetical protein